MFYKLYLPFFMGMMVQSAPPAPPASSRVFPLQNPQFQQLASPDYYLDSPDAGYYAPPQRQGGASQNAGSSRLETLEPDNEVELLPGAQAPQQPPAQSPVSPNVPGLVPGQRVFIVHMPVSGYRPGAIGGYQPVYIVAAAPQGSTAYTANGLQNTILLDPTGQAVAPILGYPRVPNQQPLAPGQLVASPYGLRPLDYVYPDRNFLYQPVYNQAGYGGQNLPFRLAQFVGLQARDAASNQRPSNNGKSQEFRKERSSAEMSNEARPSRPHSRTKH